MLVHSRYERGLSSAEGEEFDVQIQSSRQRTFLDLSLSGLQPGEKSLPHSKVEGMARKFSRSTQDLEGGRPC
jgi:hypothetical protein